MRIAVNTLYMRDSWSSTGRYAYHLLRELGKIDGSNEYLLLSPRPVSDVPETPSSFHWQTAPVGSIGALNEQVERVLFEQRTFPSAARDYKAKLIHIPYIGAPMRRYGSPLVVSALDLHAIRHPDARHAPQTQAYTGLIASAARHAEAIITSTSFAKAEVVELFRVEPERIHVIPGAPDPRYSSVSEQDIARVAGKYALPRRYVLTMGGLDVRANLANLVGAFAATVHQVGDADLALVIPGDPSALGKNASYPDWRPLAATFGIAQQIFCVPIDAADMGAVYAAASCVAYVPFYESFGDLPLDALAAGVPMIYSDVGALTELIGTAGLRVDPWDVDRMSEAFLRVLTALDTAHELHERALAHIKRFSWQRAAAATATLYADIMGTRRD